jgi:hypothetical protein
MSADEQGPDGGAEVADEASALIPRASKPSKPSKGVQFALDPIARQEVFYAPFVKCHFGTDMQIAAWYLLISAIVNIVSLLIFFKKNTQTAEYPFEFSSTLLACGVGYMLATCFLLKFSYPCEYEKQFEYFGLANIGRLSLTYKFVGSYLQTSSWLMMLVAVVLLANHLHLFVLGYFTIRIFFIYFVSLCLLLSAAVLMTSAAQPVNIIKNEGFGSVNMYNSVREVDIDDMLFGHLAPDTLAAAVLYAAVAKIW